MAWEKEYKNYGAINFTDRKVYVYKTSNYKLEIDLGSGKIIEQANWSSDGVNVVYSENGKRKVRKYTSPNTFIILS